MVFNIFRRNKLPDVEFDSTIEDDPQIRLVEELQDIPNQSYKVVIYTFDERKNISVPTTIAPGLPTLPDRNNIAIDLYPVWGGRSYQIFATRKRVAYKRPRDGRTAFRHVEAETYITEYKFDGPQLDPVPSKTREIENRKKSPQSVLEDKVSQLLIRDIESGGSFGTKLVEAQYKKQVNDLFHIDPSADAKDLEWKQRGEEAIAALVDEKLSKGDPLTSKDKLLFASIRANPNVEVPRILKLLERSEQDEVTAKKKLERIEIEKAVFDQLESEGRINKNDSGMVSKAANSLKELLAIVPKDGPIADLVRTLSEGLAAKLDLQPSKKPVALPMYADSIITNKEIVVTAQVDSEILSAGKIVFSTLGPTDMLVVGTYLVDILGEPDTAKSKEIYLEALQKYTQVIGFLANVHTKVSDEYALARIRELPKILDIKLSKDLSNLGITARSDNPFESIYMKLQEVNKLPEVTKSLAAKFIKVDNFNDFITSVSQLLSKAEPVFELYNSNKGLNLLQTLRAISTEVANSLKK